MKFLRILPLVLIAIFASCTSDTDDSTVNELDGLTKFKEISNTTHIIELYKHMGGLEQGFNEIALRIKDKTTNQYIKNATVAWKPVMRMTMMSHSCPKSPVTKVSADGDFYEGYIVFQMAENAMEKWDLTFDYSINGTAYTMTSGIAVPASAKQRVASFMGSDNVRYIVAYVDPHHPKVGINDMVAGVWKMQDMMTFPAVDNYKLKIDPRMPSMGNHSSPNNVDLTQIAVGDLCQGKLSLTMTGYWKINLQLLNASGTVLKGETITDAVPASSIYFEIEF